MQKFQRNYKLTIQRDGEDEVVITYPLTIEFAIRRANLAMAATADFRIYNLSKEHRTKIYKNQTEISVFVKIKLEAGYGDNLSTVFNGNVTWARSSRAEGAKEYITSINAYDYGFVMVNSKSSFTVLDEEASQDAVIKRLCKDLTYPVDGAPTPLPIGAIGTFDKTARTKYSVNGNTWDALNAETGKKCFIDNGKVYCLGTNETIEGDITEISIDTGLLGSPRTDGIWVIIEMIFEPGLKVGQQVTLKSTSAGYQSITVKDFDGTYKVVALDHSGTISGAVSGKCKTIATLMPGSAGKTSPFTVW